MQITINGELKQIAVNTTVDALINQLGIDKRKIAVELNLSVLPRSQFATRILAEGDNIEMVNFVGGG